MKKFSELSNSSLLFINDELVCKQDVINNLQDYCDADFFIANEDKIDVSTQLVQSMLEDFSESLYQDRELYEEWDWEFMKQVDDLDMKELKVIISRIMDRVPRCYHKGEEIEFDM